MKRLLFSVMMAGVVAAGVGCSTTPSAASAAPGSEATAVMCSKCQTVWVSQAQQANKATVYSRQKKMICPDCDSAVENFFKTGKFEHTCKTCGDNLAACPMCK